MEEVTPVLEEKERSASYKPVFVTEITDDLHFYVQDVETGECSGPGSAASQPLAWSSPRPGPVCSVGGRGTAQRFQGPPQDSFQLLPNSPPQAPYTALWAHGSFPGLQVSSGVGGPSGSSED